ncbi:MAG TPA: hypothetical protein VFB62_02955 [Polyangiaceae bacterium]|nr:hypothetical protein [Polyangiaceae bacterium]
MSNTQHLRRLSLDLRLRVPDYEEYEALGEGAVSDAVVDAYLESDEFLEMVRRFHTDLLWSNVSNVSLSSIEARLVARGTERIFDFAGAVRRQTYRGIGSPPCADYPQVDYCTAADMQAGLYGCDGVGMPRKQDVAGFDVPVEGWVLVEPYWDPPSCTQNVECASRQCSAGSCAPAKVCAFAAQENEYWSAPPEPPSQQTSCNFIGSPTRQGCGCGPNLRFCWEQSVEVEIRAALSEQVDRLVEDVTVGDLPYSALLTSRRAHYNGPLFHFKKYLAQMTSLNQTFNFQFEGDAPVPEEVSYADKSWVAVERAGVHAGVLTLPAFTLRFQTNRGRANRFRNAFMGQYFEPPAASVAGCDAESNDVMKRCYCQHCHQVLEPMAAYFGQIAEAGSALISDRTVFPKEMPACAGGSQNILCRRFYVSTAGEENLGRLLPLQYAGDDSEAHRQIEPNFDAGPAALAEQAIADGTFARTIVQHLWRYFMRREMDLSLGVEDESALLDELAAELASQDDFVAIVRRIVSLEHYRRMR